jgi:hypothetical protein
VERGRAIPGGAVVLALDALAKAALFTLLLHAVANPDLPQYADKAMLGRALTFPLAVLVIPAGWALLGRSRGLPFPALADLLITLPFLIDTAGNALDLYDSIEWWDDANHLFNWMLLTGGFVLLTEPVRLAAWNRAALGAGFAAIAAIAWEVMEYVTFIPGSPEAAGAYRDTLGDLVLGTIGGSLASIVASRWIARRRPGPGPRTAPLPPTAR